MEKKFNELKGSNVVECSNGVSTDVDNVKVDVPTDDNVIDNAEDTKPESK